MNNNPLQQYFRRPGIYIALPTGGKFYDASTVDMPENKQFAVYPMTSIDEITTRTPDAVFSGQAVVDVIHSCIPNIKNAWNINICDMDTILIAIKIASNGESMDVSSVCPACKHDNTFGVNLVSLLNKQKIADYGQLFDIGDLKIKFKPLTFKESNKNNLMQYELQKVLETLDTYENTEEKAKYTSETIKKLNTLMVEIVSETIECIVTPETKVSDKTFIKEYLVNCDRQTNNFIKEQSVKLKNESQMQPLNMKCQSCGHEYRQDLILNVTDFFA